MEAVFGSLCDVGSWFVAKGELEDLPTIVRGRTGLGDLREHPALSLRLTIRWDYACDDEGLPDADASSALGTFEETLVSALESAGLAILTMVFTHGGCRIWTLYASDIEEISRRLNAALPHDPPLPIQMSAEEDPSWNEYRKMIEGTRLGSEDPAL